MRICSFFSSATELLYAIGCGRSVVGRSERCDYPDGALSKPIVVRSRIPSERLSSKGIDEAVQELRRKGEHHYRIDLPLLKRLQPDLVVTQELCNVCAASHPEVVEAIRQLPRRPKAVSICARRFEELFDSIETLGAATGREKGASVLVGRLRKELEEIRRRVERVRHRPRVWCAEWLDPLLAAGHWIPEMVSMAGGEDPFGRVGEDSGRIDWQEVRRVDPEVILVMPCSFTMGRTRKEIHLLSRLPGWERLSAVKAKRVYAVETSLFHRPGPRLVKGLRLMASLFQPDLFPVPPASQARPLL
ncbi:MAG: ABC transporter substrate-binding protein [Candidatus Omnitrophica bacterium]|nr:ABC transporter substrate-binding protein [Candidatus Omnitrophota bacterium]